MRRMILLAPLLSACLIGGGSRTVTALELRAGVAGIRWGALDPRARAAIQAGQIWTGASEAELFMSRGQPHLWWNTRLTNNKACRVFVHHTGDPNIANLAVTTCDGRVIGTNQIEPPLPCWRLADVGPRITAAATYFEQRPLEVQWQIVIGLLHRGQAEKDVLIAFGEPHNRGFDEREDGKRAEKLVFLDRSNDAYGLNVTLIDDKIVGWQMPAERVLTPEAQQRRLEAMEKRLTERIAEVERKAIQQHAETVKLFSEVMERQEEMLANLTKPPAPVVVLDAAGAEPGRTPDAAPPRHGPPTHSRERSSIETSTTRSDPPRSDFFDKRNACMKECERKYYEAANQCKQRFPAEDAKGLAECISNNATAPMGRCNKQC